MQLQLMPAGEAMLGAGTHLRPLHKENCGTGGDIIEGCHRSMASTTWEGVTGANTGPGIWG